MSSTSAASTAPPSTWRSAFLLILKLSILTFSLQLWVCSSPQACLCHHCFSTTHQPPSLAVVSGDGELLQKVYTWSCSEWGSQGLLYFSWSPQMDSPFISAKSALALVPTLVHPEPSSLVSLAVDASDAQMGAVFQQLVQGSWAPIAFYSKKLSSAETRYSPFDCELLAAYSAVKHFCFLLQGRNFSCSLITNL